MGNNSFTDRKQRWRAFYSGDASARHMFLISPAPEEPRPLPWPSLRQERIEWAWKKYCRQLECSEWLQDDAIPYLDMLTGTEIFAEAFGCAVHRPADTMPFALPLITQASEVSGIRVPELSATPLAGLFDMADELRHRAGDEALLRMVDIQSPMDIAALIWDKTEFYVAMLTEPDAVKELAGKVMELLTAFLDEWFSRYGREFIAHYPTYYMPDGLTLSEDEIGIVNAGMFEEFYLPKLARLSERYGGLGMHCCADARHQWGGFLRIPGLRIVNICRPRDAMREAYSFFAPHVAQMPMPEYWHKGDPWTWPAQVPAGSRIVFSIDARSREEAITTAQKMQKVCRAAP